MKLISLTAALLLISAPAMAASFDCAKAASAVEKIVCADKDISALDDELNKLYQDRLAVAIDKPGLKSMQRNWLKSLSQRCKDADCVKMDYDIQIETLKGLVSEEFSANYKTPVEKRLSITGQGKEGFTFRLSQTDLNDGSVICAYPASDDAPAFTAKFDGEDKAKFHSGATGCSIDFKINRDKYTTIDLDTKGCDKLCKAPASAEAATPESFSDSNYVSEAAAQE
jgi:uncharacterized protein